MPPVAKRQVRVMTPSNDGPAAGKMMPKEAPMKQQQRMQNSVEEIPETDEEMSVSGYSDASNASAGGDKLAGRLNQIVSQLTVRNSNGMVMDDATLVQQIIQQVSHSIRTLAPVAVLIMDCECTVVDCNPKAVEMFGRSADELCGRNIKAIMPPEIGAKHDNIVNNYLQKYEKIRKPPRSVIVGAKEGREVLALRMVKGKPQTFNAKVAVRGIPHPAGKHVPPLFFLGYVEDITERRKLAEALEINAFIREKGETPMVVMSDYGKILDFNQAASDMFRYNRRFVVGQNIKKLMPPEISAVHDEKLEAYRERVSTGMLHTSPVVGVPRNLTGYRPKFETSGCEEFQLELRVESFSGGKVLVAFLKDLSSAATSEFMANTTDDMFPKHTHERLMNGEPVWDQEHEVTVLFCDVAQFSAMTADWEAEDVFKFINDMVSAFDDMGYGMEKIKTIGDCYMAYFYSADDALYTGLRMLEWAIEQGVALRVGLHTGTVVSGVIGTKRRTFDMWGDVVNTGKRMEEQGTGGQIQISGETYDAIMEDELRGLFVSHTSKVKGKGIIGTYITDLTPGSLPDHVQALLVDRDVEERSRQASQNAKGQGDSY